MFFQTAFIILSYCFLFVLASVNREPDLLNYKTQVLLKCLSFARASFKFDLETL